MATPILKLAEKRAVRKALFQGRDDADGVGGVDGAELVWFESYSFPKRDDGADAARHAEEDAALAAAAAAQASGEGGAEADDGAVVTAKVYLARQRASEFFQRIDLDQGGSISRDELAQFLLAKHGLSHKLAMTIFDQMDANGSGARAASSLPSLMRGGHLDAFRSGDLYGGYDALRGVVPTRFRRPPPPRGFD